ncbi:MAG: MBL fold metallo-hydrolase [Deltaproteobacteria bacterium]|jgi:glyoxylase-like metal-dependent hydrolase (beta-lactamase superfamily II)|nr:MBL fold metallo-hydrolase [Deltaproteobacteria bacterium]
MKTAVIFLIVLLAGLRFGAPSQAQAQKADEAAGTFLINSGDLKIYALSDATGSMGYNLLIGASPADLSKIAQDNGLSPKAQAFPSYVNVFLVVTPSDTILVDTGNGPQANLLASLKKINISPDDITAVILTHFHGDHIGGLLSIDNQPQFKNAFVYADSLEYDYWITQNPTERVKKALAPYEKNGRYKSFAAGDNILKGVKALPLYGHTAGHTGFLFDGGEKPFLAWGDIVHVAYVQFGLPEISMTYDSDPKKAAETRESIFKEASEKGYLVSGAHLPFPGIGYVSKKGQAYEFKLYQ